MVVLTCNNCGDAVKKPRVVNHMKSCQTKPAAFTCVDCHKDFDEKTVGGHTKCVTESERYGPKNTEKKPTAADTTSPAKSPVNKKQKQKGEKKVNGNGDVQNLNQNVQVRNLKFSFNTCFQNFFFKFRTNFLFA